MEIILLLYLLCIIWFVIAFLVKSPLVTGLCILVAIGMYIWANIERKNEDIRKDAAKKRKSEQDLAQIPHTQKTLSTDYLTALLINENINRLYIASKENYDSLFEIKEYAFNEILEVAIVEDKNLLSLLPKDGLLGASLNNDGTVVHIINTEDGAEDKEKDDEQVSKLSIKMVVDDLLDPLVEYMFLDNEDEIDKESDEYKDGFKLCNEWYQKISVIIKRQERVPVREWR